MTAYDSVERGAADECEPLRGRRPRTFTLTQLLVACGAVCVCSIAATTAVNTPRATSSDAHLGDAHLGDAPGRRTHGRRTHERRTWATHTWASPVFTGNLGSCAFVANNPNLPMGGGPKIDAHDTVVRFNNFWERRISDKRKGTKVDLLVIIAKFKEFKKNYRGKCILRTSRRDRWNSKEIREAGCETIPRRVYHACMRSLKDQYNATQNFPPVVPSTGMLGVMHIGHRCASIALYGFTLPEPPYPTFPQVPHLFAEEHAVLKSVFPKAVFH